MFRTCGDYAGLFNGSDWPVSGNCGAAAEGTDDEVGDGDSAPLSREETGGEIVASLGEWTSAGSTLSRFGGVMDWSLNEVSGKLPGVAVA
jgi:hypothetical protein